MAISEVNIDEMEDIIADGGVLIDVREEDELEIGTIKGYVHMPLSSFDEYKDKLPKDKPIVFYCKGGGRSLKAAQIAARWGLDQDLYSLRGGYSLYSQER
jgi:rhodanese-related sulfurtransferase